MASHMSSLSLLDNFRVFYHSVLLYHIDILSCFPNRQSFHFSRCHFFPTFEFPKKLFYEKYYASAFIVDLISYELSPVLSPPIIAIYCNVL